MQGLVILFDVDNTLLDNDAVKAQLARDLDNRLGKTPAERFWEIYEEVREANGLVDIPETIARFASKSRLDSAREMLTGIFFDFPFRDYVFPAVPEVLASASQSAKAAIVSDGDQAFQKEKIRSSGLEALVDGGVLIFDHKEEELERIQSLLPAKHYVMVDDKPRILDALKLALGERITTVFVRQGKYALAGHGAEQPDPDVTLDSIAGFLELTLEDLNGRRT